MRKRKTARAEPESLGAAFLAPEEGSELIFSLGTKQQRIVAGTLDLVASHLSQIRGDNGFSTMDWMLQVSSDGRQVTVDDACFSPVEMAARPDQRSICGPHDWDILLSKALRDGFAVI